MTSGYTPGSMPEKGEPDLDQILRALREELKENPQLKEMPAEEVGQATRPGRTPGRGARPTSGRGGPRGPGGRGAEFAA